MADLKKVVAAAERLSKKDEAALELEVGKRLKAIEKRPELKDDPEYEPPYDSTHMGLVDDVKALGRRVVNRWNKELYGLVCQGKPDDRERQAVISALKLGEVAVIGAVVTALIGLAVPAAIAAAAAPLIVKRFIWPAKDELCEAWGESVNSAD